MEPRRRLSIRRSSLPPEERMITRYIPQILALGVALVVVKLYGPSFNREATTIDDIKEYYDYIIVGGGTSGAVLASRITEDEQKKVLLIEAGEDQAQNPDVNIPIMGEKVRGSDLDWNFETIPQKYACKSHTNRVALWHCGKGLGGTSNINYMQYHRGSRHDYDSWAAQGATGWSFKDVLPYFIKSEDNRNGDYVRTVFHGFGGRLTVQDTILSPVTQIMTLAFKELGIEKKDINGKSHFGYAHSQATIRNGIRWSTDKAFLKRAMFKDNLDVITGALAEKILIENKKAIGLSFRHAGKQRKVKAKKEVIVSSGTIGSAKLLLLSGIGPRKHLEALKIPVIADLPVGENLQDQVQTGAIEFFTKHHVSITAARAENFLSSWAYTLFGTGMKMSPRFREGTAFIKVRQQPPHIKYPLIALQVVANVATYSAEQLNLDPDSWNAMHDDLPSKEGFSIYPILLHPRSRGTIKLRSNNPEDPPLINPNYLADDADVKILVEAIQFVRSKLADTKVLKDWDFQLSDKILPECSEHGNFTNQYWECFIRHITLSGASPVGTCKVGAIGDPTAVVDPLLRVRGIKGLRVIDASIIPKSVSGNTYATQVMIAERASDLIREKDTVKKIKDYFKHLISVKHEKFKDEDSENVENRASKEKKKHDKQKPK